MAAAHEGDQRGMTRRRLLQAAAAGGAVLAAGSAGILLRDSGDGSPATAAAAASTPAGPIVLGQINESFHQVAGGVVHQVLLDLGHDVEVREGPHPEIYPLLATGGVDLFATSWLPGGHGTYWTELAGSAREVAPLYEGARFFWAVPSYVPPEAASSLADLARPELVARMSTQVVQGTGSGAGLTMRSRQLLTDYGLDRAGWSYATGTVADVVRTVRDNMDNRRWFVTPLWQPQFLNDVYDLRALEDPLAVFPPPDVAVLTANTQSYGRLPADTRRVLERVRFTVQDTTEMDLAVNINGLSTLDAARQWMAQHPQQVAQWSA
jgi:glycine betaine/proline transport system substrate-binding protein